MPLTAKATWQAGKTDRRASIGQNTLKHLSHIEFFFSVHVVARLCTHQKRGSHVKGQEQPSEPFTVAIQALVLSEREHMYSFAVVVLILFSPVHENEHTRKKEITEIFHFFVALCWPFHYDAQFVLTTLEALTAFSCDCEVAGPHATS